MDWERTGESMLKTLQGFKDFIMRGNVIDLSVGIVIGAAFTALVAAFTSAFIEPLIKVFGGGGLEGGSFTINDVAFPWASFINGLFTFVITAAVLYFLVVTPMNKLSERRRKGTEPEPKKPNEEILLLQEIRDALVAGTTLPEQRAAASKLATEATAQVAEAEGWPGASGRR